MKKTIKTGLVCTFFVLFNVICVYALDQGEPVDGLSVKGVTFLEFEIEKDTGTEQYKFNLPVALETQGLWGPVSLENPVAAYYWEKYKEKGMKTAVEYNPNADKEYQTPFIRMTAVQSVGKPVKIKLLAPAPEEITIPLAGKTGPAGNVRYTVLKRIFSVRILDSRGNITLDEDKARINMVENMDTLEIQWTPSFVEEKYGPKLTAPVVIEILLRYKIKRDMIVNGKIDAGWSRDGWIDRRVAWIAMPICGQEFGEDDEPLVCPADVDPGASWKEYGLGPVSLQVPDSWDSKTRNGSGRFELGDGLAGISVIREEGAEEQIKYIKEMKETPVTISGLSAVEYTGLVKDGKVKAKMIIFKDMPTDNKVLAIATALKDDRYADILAASLGSMTIDNGKSEEPGIDPSPEPHLPVLAELGKGEYNYSPNNIPGKEYGIREQSGGQAKKEDPGDVQTYVPPAQTVSSGTVSAVNGHLVLKKIKGFSDFVGRGEALQGDGSPDSQLRLEIEASDKTITSLVLREKDTKNVVWDTTGGNGAWLVCMTRKNKPINQADGSVSYRLGAGKEKLDLWVQDDHTIDAGIKEIELVLGLDNNDALVIPMKR